MATSPYDLNQKTLVIYGRLSRLKSAEVKALVKAAGGKVSGSVSKRTDLMITNNTSGVKLADARALNIRVEDEAFLEQILSQLAEAPAPSTGKADGVATFRARFETMVAELKKNKLVRILNYKVQNPANQSKLAKAEKNLGRPLPADIRAFYEQCNGLSLVWTDHGDSDVPPNQRPVSGFLGKKHHMIFENCSPKNAIVLLPVEEVFAATPSIPVYEPEDEDDKLFILGKERRPSDVYLRVMDMVNYFYMTGLFIGDGEAQMVLGNDHGASWGDSIGVEFADYLELVLGTRGGIAARTHFLEHGENWEKRDLDAHWASQEAGLRGKPTAKSLEARRKADGDDAMAQELIVGLYHPSKPIQAYCQKTLPLLEVNFEPYFDDLRGVTSRQVPFAVCALAYERIPPHLRDISELNKLFGALERSAPLSEADSRKMTALLSTVELTHLLDPFKRSNPHSRLAVVTALTEKISVDPAFRAELLAIVAKDDGYLGTFCPPSGYPYKSQAGIVAAVLMHADPKSRHLDALAHALVRSFAFVSEAFDLVPAEIWGELVDQLLPLCLAAAPHAHHDVWWNNMMQLPLTDEEYQALVKAGLGYQSRFAGERPLFNARVEAAISNDVQTLLPWLRDNRRGIALAALAAKPGALDALREWTAQDKGYQTRLDAEGRPDTPRTDHTRGLAAVALAHLSPDTAPIDALVRAAIEDGLTGALWYDTIPRQFWSVLTEALLPTEPNRPNSLQDWADEMKALPVEDLLKNLIDPTLGVRDASLVALKARPGIHAALTEMTQQEAGFLERFCAEGAFARPSRTWGIERQHALAAVALWHMDPSTGPDLDALSSGIVHGFRCAPIVAHLPDTLWGPLADRLIGAYHAHNNAQIKTLRENLVALPLTEEDYEALMSVSVKATRAHIRTR